MEKNIKEILSNLNLMKGILELEDEDSYELGFKKLKKIIKQALNDESLYSNKEFIMCFIDNIIALNNQDLSDSVIYFIAELTEKDLSVWLNLFNDEALCSKLFDLLEGGSYNNYEPYQIISSKLVTDIHDKELAIRSYNVFANADCISRDLLEDKEFFLEFLDRVDICYLRLPEKFNSDVDVLKKYFLKVQVPNLDDISIEVLNNESVAKIIEDRFEMTPNESILRDIENIIKKTGAIVTHYGDDLDNKSAIEAVRRWAEDNDYIKIGHPLEVIRVPAGQIKNGMLNVDTGGHNGSFTKSTYPNYDWIGYADTVIIDGDTEHGVKSACEALSRLGIYVPQQIVELADIKVNKVSSLDSRSGLALVRYLNGDQIFKLAEAGLVDKSLTDEQLEEYGLTDAHKKQQEIIDNAVANIERYTCELPNGEKMVLSPVQILAGSSIAYEKGINYYVSTSQHYDKDGIPDGVTFAITCKPGMKLPEEVLQFGRELAEKYRTAPNVSDVFVHPNNQMIVAGGFKNPDFKIAGESTYGILNKILERFSGEENKLKI